MLTGGNSFEREAKVYWDPRCDTTEIEIPELTSEFEIELWPAKDSHQMRI